MAPPPPIPRAAPVSQMMPIEEDKNNDVDMREVNQIRARVERQLLTGDTAFNTPANSRRGSPAPISADVNARYIEAIKTMEAIELRDQQLRAQRQAPSNNARGRTLDSERYARVGEQITVVPRTAPTTTPAINKSNRVASRSPAPMSGKGEVRATNLGKDRIPSRGPSRTGIKKPT